MAGRRPFPKCTQFGGASVPSSIRIRAGSYSEEALAALAAHGADARILAGGQSLIPAMRYRLARPAVLVDINPIDELAYIKESGGMLTIGALTRDFALEQSALIASNYPLLDDVSAVVADPVVRQMGTVVGSLCHNDPAGDWGVAALASRAQIVVRGPKGERVVAIDDFLVDSYTTSLADGEMAIEVRFPTPAGASLGARISRSSARSATSQPPRPRSRSRWPPTAASRARASRSGRPDLRQRASPRPRKFSPARSRAAT